MTEYERLRAELRDALDQIANLTEENTMLKADNKGLSDCVCALKKQLEDVGKDDIAAPIKPFKWNNCGGGIWWR